MNVVAKREEFDTVENENQVMLDPQSLDSVALYAD